MALLYGVQACSSNPGLAMLPIAHFLKTDLGFSATEVAGFQAIAFLPWFLKPLFGLVIDSFSLWGFRSKSYLLVCYSWVMFGFLGFSQLTDYSYGLLLGGVVSISLAIAFSDVVADKLMITEGKAADTTAQLQGAQWVGLGVSGAAMLLLGGWLTERVSLSVVFGLSAIAPALGILGVWRLLVEPRQQVGGALGNVGRTVGRTWKLLRQRRFLGVMLLIVLLGFCPIPPTYFYQRDTLQFSNEFIGRLSAFSLLGTGLGALVFGRLASWIAPRNFVYGVIGLNAIATASLALMRGTGSAIAIAIFMGISGIWATLLIFELIIQACPEGAEGTVYALAVALSNFAVSLGLVFGSWLYDGGISFSTLALIGAGATLACLTVSPFLKEEMGA
ncbi:MAG: folate/biopterin family MFS transporter [Synechococcales cyanobacterium RM1_1_8]|nr:folate/biopterin family MFS transporter [Synechococcales cyanobacterium RM1_1_8]